MNKKFTVWGIGTIAAIATVAIAAALPANAQVVERSGNQAVHDQAMHDSNTDQHHAHKTCKASEVIGMDIRGVDGDDNIGSVNDLVLGHDGRVKYVAVSFGGFLGMGDKLFAVPFEAIDFVKTDDDAYARIDVTEETLKEKKGFNQDSWPSDADSTFTRGNLRRQAALPNASR